MTTRRIDPGRRRMCALVGAVVGHVILRPAHAAEVTADHGRVTPPLRIPDLLVRRASDGRAAGLAGLLRGRATALHLMFTGCSSVCPIQGAIFERVQALLPEQRSRGIQLLSLSIDPLADTPSALRAWLERFHARDGWTAVAPDPKCLDQALDLFGQGRDAVENHATRVNIIDRRGELVFRTPELPSADSIADILSRMPGSGADGVAA